MIFLVGLCFFRMEKPALTRARTYMYCERRSISSCASMLLYKCCYIFVQDSIFCTLSISRQVHNIGRIWESLLAIIRYIGRIWDGREKVKSPIVYWERRSTSSCASMLLYKCCYIFVQDSIFCTLSISRQVHNRENLGQSSGDYPVYGQNLGWSRKRKISDRLGIFRHTKKQSLLQWVHFTHRGAIDLSSDYYYYHFLFFILFFYLMAWIN